MYSLRDHTVISKSLHRILLGITLYSLREYIVFREREKVGTMLNKIKTLHKMLKHNELDDAELAEG